MRRYTFNIENFTAMKTQIRLATLIFFIFLIAGSAHAEKPVLKIIFTSYPGQFIEFYAPVEEEIEESWLYDLYKDVLKNRKQKEKLPMIDISAFIIPEEEIDDLDLDTSAIFKEITSKPNVVK
jgi:hypothetical protein